MKIGDRVKIINTNSIWDNKEGVVEELDTSYATVFVDFKPEEGKKVRQEFKIENLVDIY